MGILQALLIISAILNTVLILAIMAGGGGNTESEPQFVGSLQGSTYHYPDCPYAEDIHFGNLVWFDDGADARSHGYHPCGYCNPP